MLKQVLERINPLHCLLSLLIIRSFLAHNHGRRQGQMSRFLHLSQLLGGRREHRRLLLALLFNSIYVGSYASIRVYIVVIVVIFLLLDIFLLIPRCVSQLSLGGVLEGSAINGSIPTPLLLLLHRLRADSIAR